MSCAALSRSEHWFYANKPFLNESTIQSMWKITIDRFQSRERTPLFLEGLSRSETSLELYAQSVLKKLWINIFLMRGLAECVSLATPKQTYFSVCHCHIFVLQRRAFTIITGLPYQADCKIACRNLKIMALSDLFVFKNLLCLKSNVCQYQSHDYLRAHNYLRPKLKFFSLDMPCTLQMSF